jgi:hypothetical protein
VNIYTIMALIALTLIEAVALIQLMISPIGEILGVIPGPLIGAFVGVFLGFKINDNNRKKLDDERRLFFENMLCREITQIIGLLEDNDREQIPIPIDGWNALVNSGDIALFSTRATDLNTVYSEIQRYNFTIMKLRDATEEESKQMSPIYDYLRRSTTLKKITKAMEDKMLLITLPKTKEWLKDALREEISKKEQAKAKHWWQF